MSDAYRLPRRNLFDDFNPDLRDAVSELAARFTADGVADCAKALAEKEYRTMLQQANQLTLGDA